MASTNPNQLVLPEQKDYLETAKKLTGKLAESASICIALTDYLDHQHGIDPRATERFTSYFSQLGLYLEPLDPDTAEYIDEDPDTATAFMYGTTAGIMVAESVHGGIVTLNSIISNVPPFGRTQGGDKRQLQHEVAVQILDRGNRGLELMGQPAEDVIEDLESSVVPDVKKQYMFRVGCGMVALGAYDIYHRHVMAMQLKDLRAFWKDSQGAHDFDWDAGLTKLAPIE